MTQSSGKQPKNKPPEIKTRQPQKRSSGGFFDNLRQPHPIEEILGLQQEDIRRRNITPAATPVIDAGATLQQNRPFVSLDATHSASEQRVYSIMYRETIAKKIAERHFGTAELMKATGIRSDKTVRLAIDGLLQKKSIAMVRYDVGNRLGPR